MGYSGPKPPKGEPGRALADHHGSGLAPLTGAPGTAGDRGRLPAGLNALKPVAREVGLARAGAVLELEAGFESDPPRKGVFTAGLKPSTKEDPRRRPQPKRGRDRFFAAALYNLRFLVERPFAWEEKSQRLLLRFETKQRRHLGFNLIAFTLINLREFCGG
jgi:hypothetical protein